MSIGSTLRLGFDGNQVSSGLKQTEKKVGNFSMSVGKLFKGAVGAGAGAAVGIGIVDLLGKIALAPAQWTAEVADWSGELVDMTTQTGVSIKKLVTLQEALRLSGVEGADMSRVISTLGDTLYTAAKEGGPAAEALKRIGLDAETLKGMGIDDAFYSIGKAVAELNKTTQTPITFTGLFGEKTSKIVETTTKFEGLESAMSDIFGSKMGYKLQRFFKDFTGSMTQAENNVGSLGNAMDAGLAVKLDKFADSMGRFQAWKRSAATIGLEEIFRIRGAESVPDKLFDFLNPERLRPLAQQAGNVIGRNLEAAMSQGDIGKSFGDFTQNIGRLVGDGVKGALGGDAMRDFGKLFGEGVKSAVFGDSGKKGGSSSFLPRLLGMGGKDATASTAPLIEDTNSILSDIRKNTLTSYFA